MSEAILTLLCFAAVVIYIKFQDRSISLDDFKNESYPKNEDTNQESIILMM